MRGEANGQHAARVGGVDVRAALEQLVDRLRRIGLQPATHRVAACMHGLQPACMGCSLDARDCRRTAREHRLAANHVLRGEDATECAGAGVRACGLRGGA